MTLHNHRKSMQTFKEKDIPARYFCWGGGDRPLFAPFFAPLGIDDTGLFIYLFIYLIGAQGTQFPRAVNIKREIKHVWKGHGADSEIGNVSARQAALNRWTATDKRWKRKTVSRGSVVTSNKRLPICARNS